MSYSNNARIEVMGLSRVLELRLRPITSELNQYPLHVNKQVWEINLAEARELAHFSTDLCRHLVGDSLFRPNSRA